VRKVATKARTILVPEMNRGQMLRQVQRVVPQAVGYHKTDGELITANEVWRAVQEAMPA
jgi:hypothetical protein